MDDESQLECMRWSKTGAMPDNWDRKSRRNVTYASRARLEMIVEYLSH